MTERTFRVVLIKPSHYDDDGYVIQWRRSTIPSNSLASVYGLLAECAESARSAPTLTSRSRPTTSATRSSMFRRLAERILADGRRWSALIGVQSNQFPRALDLGRAVSRVALRSRRRLPCLRLHLDAAGLPPDLQEALALGIILLRGRG